MSTVSTRRFLDASKVLLECAAGAGKDLRIAKASRPALVEERQARAVVSLRRALELDYFSNPRSRSELRAPQFAALHERADFKRLLLDFEKKHPPIPRSAPRPESKK